MKQNSQTTHLCQRPAGTHPVTHLRSSGFGALAVRWRFSFALVVLFISSSVGQSQQAVGGDPPHELQKAETKMHGAGADAGQFPELVLQSGHSGAVSAIAFSRDQELLATVDFGGRVRLWNPQTGEVIRVLPTYSESGLCLAFSPDDKTLALGNFQGEVVLFETASGRLIRRYAGHRDRVWSVSFSPDGQKLASVADDGTIRLRHTESGKVLKTFTVASTKGQREKLFVAVQFAPRDDILFAVDSEGLLYQFDAQTGKQQTQWPGAGRVLAISPDGELVASVAASDADEMSRHARDKARSVTVWKTDSGQVRFTLPVNDYVLSLAFSADGKTLLAALGNPHGGFWDEEEAIPPGRVLEWSMESGSLMRHRLVPGGQVSQLATIPVRALGQGAGQPNQPAQITNAHIPRIELFASISQGDGRVRLWNLHPELVGPSASNDVPILLSPERVLPTDWAKVKSMAVTPDGTALAVGDVSGVQFWNLSSLTLVKRVPDEISLERTVLCAPTGTFFGAAGSHEDGPIDSKVEPHVRLYTPDGEPLPAAGQHNPGTTVDEKRYATTGAFSISTDGQRIAIAEDYHVRVLDIRTGRKLREWSAGDLHLTRLHFLPPIIRAQKAVDSNSANDGKINQEKTSAEKTTAEKAGRALGSRGRAQPAELIVGVARTMSDTSLRVWPSVNQAGKVTGLWRRFTFWVDGAGFEDNQLADDFLGVFGRNRYIKMVCPPLTGVQVWLRDGGTLKQLAKPESQLRRDNSNCALKHGTAHDIRSLTDGFIILRMKVYGNPQKPDINGYVKN